jgi:hypothetical protein
VFFAGFAAVLACAGWITYHIHPMDYTAAESCSTNLAGRFAQTCNNAASSALEGLTRIKKIYRIEENAAAAPVPDSAAYGSVADPAEIQALTESFSELLDGQSLVWNAGIEQKPGTEIAYYADDTILALSWSELRGGSVYTFAEVKIADASQFRRHLAGSAYGSGLKQRATEMAGAVNAVVAANGDFYAFRSYGINVYQRQLCRFGYGWLDTCFVSGAGDLLLVKSGTFATEDEAKAYIGENDVLFGLSFGPILVEDGRAITSSDYPIGEVRDYYARSAIGQLGSLHYLLMTAGSATVVQEAAVMAELGCVNAYALDGGQTAEIVMGGKPCNRVAYGTERYVSDILYFATAIPD